MLVLLGLSLNEWGNRDRERQIKTVYASGVGWGCKEKIEGEQRELRKGKTEREKGKK